MLRRLRASAIALSACLVLGAASLSAEGPFRNRDNKNPKDLSEGTYPIPYQRPTIAEITEVLERVRTYLEETEPNRVVDRRTGAEITDFSVPNVDARIPRGDAEALPSPATTSTTTCPGNSEPLQHGEPADRRGLTAGASAIAGFAVVAVVLDLLPPRVLEVLGHLASGALGASCTDRLVDAAVSLG